MVCYHRNGEPEGGAVAGGADDADVALHDLHETATDGQPEPGAAEAAGRGAVGLGEALEEVGLVLGRDADARILDFDPQAEAGGLLHLDRDA